MTGDKVFGERLGATARLRSSYSSPSASSSSGSATSTCTMGDNHGVVAAMVPTFPVALYVHLVSYLALALVPFVYLLDVLVCPHVVQLSSTYVLLTSEIKLTWKLLNILTDSTSHFFDILFYTIVLVTKKITCNLSYKSIKSQL
jgi:hypothetical protein